MKQKVALIRLFSQISSTFLFLYLFFVTQSRGEDEIKYTLKLFLEFDPLASLSTILSNKSFFGISYLFLFFVLATFLLGRVFCGWVCPLGFLFDLVGNVSKAKKRAEKNWFRFKYYLLFFMLAAHFFSIQICGFFDPLIILARSLAVFLYPVFVHILYGFVDLFYSLKPLSGFADRIHELLTFLSFNRVLFKQSSLIGVLFLFILGLNLLQRRFYCKYLCPLGALLGLISSFSLLKRYISSNCNLCGRCTSVCNGAINLEALKWYASECIECFECENICPKGAISRGKKEAKGILNLDRRFVVFSLFLGGVSFPILRVNPFSQERYFNPRLIRPPGAISEPQFLKVCIRCGNCMKVCPTGGLQPSFLESGLEGIWTPILVPKIGYCEFGCTMCGQVCPVGAIRKLSPEQKKRTKIGLAIIDRNRCIPYVFGKPCIVCEEVCPTPKKAIWLEEKEVVLRDGKRVKVKQPHVDPELCVGCGICEAKCPVSDSGAIYITSLEESRSKRKRLFLEDHI